MYIEGRTKKPLAKSTIKRAVDKLVKSGLLLTEETPLGTIFTIIRIDSFTCEAGTGDFFLPSVSRNGDGTKFIRTWNAPGKK